MNDLVSIVLPVYNGEKYLRESIESVLNQTYKNFELIIVDDCSTDSTPGIVKEYMKNDSRIIYHRNHENIKLPRSLNQGFRLSKGDYLTWTSDDNRYRKNAIEYMVSEIKKAGCEFLFTAFCTIDENGQEIGNYIIANNDVLLIPVKNVVGPSFMYTRVVYESIGDYDENLFLTEDFDYWQRIYAKFGAEYKNSIVYDYRLHGESLTDTRDDKQFYVALSKTMKKNRVLFPRFTLKQNYYYFEALSIAEGFAGETTDYSRKFLYYETLYFFRYELFNKIKRFLKR